MRPHSCGTAPRDTAWRHGRRGDSIRSATSRYYPGPSSSFRVITAHKSSHVLESPRGSDTPPVEESPTHTRTHFHVGKRVRHYNVQLRLYQRLRPDSQRWALIPSEALASSTLCLSFRPGVLIPTMALAIQCCPFQLGTSPCSQSLRWIENNQTLLREYHYRSLLSVQHSRPLLSAKGPVTWPRQLSAHSAYDQQSHRLSPRRDY